MVMALAPRLTSEAQVSDLNDVDTFAAYDDLIGEHAARDDDVEPPGTTMSPPFGSAP
jgi:hypothetical protein